MDHNQALDLTIVAKNRKLQLVNKDLELLEKQLQNALMTSRSLSIESAMSQTAASLSTSRWTVNMVSNGMAKRAYSCPADVLSASRLARPRASRMPKNHTIATVAHKPKCVTCMILKQSTRCYVVLTLLCWTLPTGFRN
jgi:hypothetical protein